MSFEVANSWLVCNAIHVSNLFSDSFQYVANFSTPIHNISKFNLTKLHHKNGNSLVLLHYLTLPRKLGINHAVETSRADIERIEGIGAIGTVLEKVFF